MSIFIFFEDDEQILNNRVSQCAADVSKGIPLDELMSTLDVHGRFIMVALPDDKLPQMSVFRMSFNSIYPFPRF